MSTVQAGTVPPLAVEALTVRYGRTTAVEDLSLAVPAGSVYTLLGRNGAGKTSVVRCALGQQAPARGRAALFGRDAWRERSALMETVGVVPEEPDAPPEATALQLARLGRRLYRTWDAESFAARLRRFDVPVDQPFARLSKGQKGAVMLALALAPWPSLLVLDDPTLGLDVVARQSFFEELIDELAERGVTVFLTTHDLAGVAGIADHVGILKGTRLVVNEDMQALRSRFRRVRWRGGRATEPGSWPGFELGPVRSREWGHEAVITNFDQARFDELAGRPGLGDAETSGLSLEEIFSAVVGEKGAGA